MPLFEYRNLSTGVVVEKLYPSLDKAPEKLKIDGQVLTRVEVSQTAKAPTNWSSWNK